MVLRRKLPFLWATLVVGALVAAVMVAASFLVFVQSGEAAPQAADKQPSVPVSPRIVGGTAVPNGKYPFMAYVKRYRNGKFWGFCGGSLIDRDSVLTAAHCLKNMTGAVVVVGRTDLRNKNRGQVIEASKPFIHPRYHGNGYDAGVLKLRRAVKGIKPIKLATAKQNDLEKPGHVLTAAGWGVTTPKGNTQAPPRMREVSIPVVSDSRTKRAYQSQGLKYLPSLMVAAGKKGKSPCYGDSGGPLFDSGSRTQVGITSEGPRSCGSTRYPAVYTEVNNPEIRNFILPAAKR
jgi:secreted trypsin-like serine protease